MSEKTLEKGLKVAFLILLAVLSFFPAAKWASAPETYQQTIDSIDSKVETVLKLTATSTLASAGVSAIPGDTATPIAEKLADFTEYFLLILCVLYGEKYLLTLIGTAAFRILIPVACLLFIIAIFRNPAVMKKLGFKFAILAIALFVTIPLSIKVSDMIYNTYQDSIETAIAEAEEFTDETAELSAAKDNETLVERILEKLSETASSLSDKAAQVMNNFVELLAVMIVTSCLIPIVVLVFFIWLIKVLTGVEIPMPGPHKGEHQPEKS